MKYVSNTSKYLVVVAVMSALVGCGGGSSSTQDTVATPVTSLPAATISPLSVNQENPEATQSPFASFTFSAEGAASFQCKLDDDTAKQCSSPYIIYPLSVGEHELTVSAIDNAGNAADSKIMQWTTHSIFGDDTEVAHTDLAKTNVQPAPLQDNGWKGILRINCDFAHSSYNDPIVFPGQTNAAHLHRFYGNLLTDENSDLTSLFTEGGSSCQGNTLNRSAYWVPALLAPAYDPETQQPLYDENGEPAWKAVPAVVGNDDEAHEVFYYSAGVSDLSAIQPIPLGLKMIAGDHMGQPGMEQDTSIARWHCQSWESDEVNNPQWSTSIPECKAPDRLRFDIFFPSCWNGLDLDSSDHKSHLAYPVSSGNQGGTVCPSTHPVPIIRVSFHYAFGVKPDVYEPQTQSSRGWRLAADIYQVSNDAPGGMSLHGDWFNAWHPEALQAVLEGCIKGRLDCHDGNLANGFRLGGTQAGMQTEPAVINSGLGG
jgi:hypothetical protein